MSDKLCRCCGKAVVGEKKSDWQDTPWFCDSCFDIKKEHNDTIWELAPIFNEAGFGGYSIDFSDIDSKLIRMLAETCKKYLEEEK